ncbi:hypothetical protein [Fundidesulfovibrio terrae]|uniref:hypothetical protein n=1 Tax=Fundidesulfovibrio terrae TaxID=2922866 RepID=UPI001FAF1928|nr:hypothetical protein [Fundidesulfovibrio terrae]
MWIFSRDGFFSVAATKFCQPGEVAVRARKKEHLESLMERHGISAEILTFPEADYRYRIQIPKEIWGRALQDEANDLDYNSFKDAMAQAGMSADYLRAMFSTWSIIHKIQTEELPRD